MECRSVIILDTHVWIWWLSRPDALSNKALAVINYAKTIGICPISCWEISTKVAQGKLKLDRKLSIWMDQALARPGVTLVDLSAKIAVSAGQLGEHGFHGDPADRLIVATAMTHSAELITKDRKIRAFPKVRTLW